MKMKKTGKSTAYQTVIAPENRVVEYREKRNLSQKQLADLSGIDSSVLNRIEKRLRHISGEELIELSRVLKAPTYELLPIVSGIPCAEFYDDTRMAAVIIAVLEAYEKYRMKPAAQDVADLVSFLYQRSVTKRLSVKDVRELANNHVKAGKNSLKADPVEFGKIA